MAETTTPRQRQSTDQTARTPWRDWFALMRPRQWTKNLVVFAALLFSLGAKDPAPLPLIPRLMFAAAAFLVFCALSSAGYMVNDTMDRDKDRAHPTKCKRPIAAGRIAPTSAIIVAAILAAGALATAALVHGWFAVAAAGYLTLTLTYSFCWKHEVILDLVAITGGFLLRAVAGALIIGVAVSPWLFICVSLLAMMLGLGKRRHELSVLQGGKQASHRPVLTEYSTLFLNQALTMIAGTAIVTYAVYTIDSPTARNYPALVATVPLVMYAVLRYLYLIFHRDVGGHPEELFLTDRPLYITVALWAATVVGIFTIGKGLGV
jgi:4-hydroxybenzoate polyprenyltransferase